MKVENLYIYPVKSLRGISLDSVQVRLRGFDRDRRWMLIDNEGTFFTQRTVPELAKFDVVVSNDRMEISFENLGLISIPYFAASGGEFPVRIWDDTVDAMAGPPRASEWFSKYLDKPCRLVYMPDATMRRLSPEYGKKSDAVSFADGYPVLLASTASLDDLNSRMDQVLSMSHFRPNLVISGANAWDEDNWSRIRVGETSFRVVKPCPRCVVTTANPSTGKRGNEPLTTLAKFRKKDGEVFFGMNLIPDGLGKLSVGDKVEII